MKADPIGSHGEYPALIFEVPPEVADEAREGLWYREEYGFGGTPVGESRAIQLSTGRPPVTLRDIVVMNSYFARHAGDKIHQYNPPSAGMIAWKLWGGSAGLGWVRDIMTAYEADSRHGEIHYLLEYGREDRRSGRSRSNPRHDGMLANCVVQEHPFRRKNPVIEGCFDRTGPRDNPAELGGTPIILQRCILQLLSREGIERPSQDDISRAFAICTSSLQNAGRIEYGTRELTPYGWEKERQYTAAERIAATVAFETMLEIARGGKPRRARRAR
jgi:hypothetical protein